MKKQKSFFLFKQQDVPKGVYPMSDKFFVLDTNVLLSNHQSPYSFQENNVVIPMVVLQELDNIKSRGNDVSRDARAAIRVLNEIIGDCAFDLQKQGVEMGEGYGRLFVVKTPAVSPVEIECNDDKIIACALELQSEKPVVLVSNDINMRLKAKGEGINYVQQFKKDIVIDDVSLLGSGYYELTEEELFHNHKNANEIKAKSCGILEIPAKIIPDKVDLHSCVNTWMYNVEHNFYAKVVNLVYTDESCEEVETVIVDCHMKEGSLMKRNCAGILPRNIQQAFAFDALLDRDIDIVVISGAAGSGKTLLSLAAAVGMMHGNKGYRYEEIIFSRSMDSQFNEIGFLPGNEQEKVAPWVMAVNDNMEVIWRASHKEEYHPKFSIQDEEKAFIKLKALNFFRGRSLNNKVMIIDEAQNLTAKQIKTLLSRAGEYCKIVLMGNLAQIDNQYVTETSSGLTYAAHKFAGWEHAAVLHLDGVVRGRLAEFVEDNFDV